MPIPTECPGCGAKFQAPDKLAGKRVKCPKCGAAIEVAGSSAGPKQPAADERTANSTIAVACRCGKRFRAKAELAGKRVKCPGCGNVLTIPDGQPAPSPAGTSMGSDLDSLLAAEMPAAVAEATPLAPVKPRKQKANTRLIVGLSAGAGVILLGLLLAMVFWPSGNGKPPLTNNPTPGQDPASPTPPGPSAPKARTERNDLALPGAVTEPPQWLLADAPFDVVKFFEAPPPEENAAPLYLDALYEFSVEMEDCFPEAERRRRSPIVAKREQRLQELHAAWQNDPNSVDPSEVDALLTEFAVGFQKLASAQERPECEFQPGINVMSLLPHLEAAKRVGQVGEMWVVRNLSRGEIDEAISRLETVARLSRDLWPRGPILISVAIDRTVCVELIPKVLAAQGSTTQQCDRLMSILQGHKPGEAMLQHGMRTDYIMVRSFLFDIEHRTGIFDTQTPISRQLVELVVMTGIGERDEQEKLLEGYEAWVAKTDFQADVDALNSLHQAVVGSGTASLRARKEQFRRLIKQAEVEMRLFQLPLGPYDSFMEAAARADAVHGGAMCLVALRRWQLENDGPSPDLATVVKAAGMERVPVDPYCRQPLRMTTIDGRPVVYSVGLDERDDQGRIEWNFDARDPQGDVLFRLP